MLAGIAYLILVGQPGEKKEEARAHPGRVFKEIFEIDDTKPESIFIHAVGLRPLKNIDASKLGFQFQKSGELVFELEHPESGDLVKLRTDGRKFIGQNESRLLGYDPYMSTDSDDRRKSVLAPRKDLESLLSELERSYDIPRKKILELRNKEKTEKKGGDDEDVEE